MKRVLCVLPLNDKQKSHLESAAENCVFEYIPADAVTSEQISDAEIIVGCVPAELIKASEKLELLQLNSAGADPYIVPGVLHGSTVLTNATGAYSKAVAEHTFASLLAVQKKLHLYRDTQLQNNWTDFGYVTSLSDSTVLVMGLGDIGLHFAKLCKAMGAYVIGVKRRPGECPEFVDELYTTDKTDELLPRADVVASIMPGTKDTVGFFTEERFALMKNTAIFLNSGRGSAVSSQVLYKALSTGLIDSAAIDVTDPEPLPADSPLWALPNLLLTPHISGGYHLPGVLDKIVDIAVYNISAHLNGGKLKNIVDFETGYKK